MSATFLVFLLCGQPIYILLDTHEDVALYAVGTMPAERKAEFLLLMEEVVESGRAKRVDFKVEEQVKGMTCGVST